ncbi:hypothetical protein AHMF7605_09845 [Adhaeribacter arboris]|uniref:Uncharacterized protein n=1 Tax=Adhaeribacter arboris TaxID=2072846 RepID=A0A2T2YE71_9BACT|nr:hypothetical protein [Adhaeribacter arboris]PSR53802.1 hypothetical protein AHMF7605_09845 [Adhaeribacter arboris]
MNRTTFYLLLFLLLVAWSCEKEGDDFRSSAQPPPSPALEAASATSQSATSTHMHELALQVINYNYDDAIYPINLAQVTGVNKQQFVNWLKTTRSATAQAQLLPLLNHPATEYVLLENVQLRSTGKLATVGLIGVPSPLAGQFARAVTIVEQSGSYGSVPVKLCIGKKCSPFYQCITWVRVIKAGTECPANQCENNQSCVLSAAPPGTTIGFVALKDAIAQF